MHDWTDNNPHEYSNICKLSWNLTIWIFIKCHINTIHKSETQLFRHWYSNSICYSAHQKLGNTSYCIWFTILFQLFGFTSSYILTRDQLLVVPLLFMLICQLVTLFMHIATKVTYPNSLDSDETPKNSESHPKPHCFTLRITFLQIVKTILWQFEKSRQIAQHWHQTRGQYFKTFDQHCNIIVLFFHH